MADAASASASHSRGASDFLWTGEAEPHLTRRRAILAKYGDQVRALYGTDWTTGAQVILVTLLQMGMAYYVKDRPWWQVLLAAYAIGGTCSQNLFCAQHELSHFLAFRKPLHNKILSYLSNIPLVVPMATAFRKYHQEHHSHLGVDGWDVDLPTDFEANWINNIFAKLAWVSTYILVYGVRPLLIRPKVPDGADFFVLGLVLGCDALVIYAWGWKAIMYLLLGSLLGGGLHPMAGHLIAEHYMFLKGQETYSYYGPLNLLTYNVGYHNEHHDFPQIPHTRLHKLHDIAPEFYEGLMCHTSWTWVIWKFLTDPEVGPWTRMKRVDVKGTAPKVPSVVEPESAPTPFTDLTNNIDSPALRTRGALRKLTQTVTVQ